MDVSKEHIASCYYGLAFISVTIFKHSTKCTRSHTQGGRKEEGGKGREGGREDSCKVVEVLLWYTLSFNIF